MEARPPFPIVVLGRIAAAYDGAPNARPLQAAQQSTLAMLVANEHDGVEAPHFAGWSSGARSLYALRMSVSRLREHLPPGCLPEAVAHRYHLRLPPGDVDFWYLRSLRTASLPRDTDLRRLRHLLRPVEPFAPLSGEPRLADAAREVRHLQRELMFRLGTERPDVLRGDLVDDLLRHLDEDLYNERLLHLCAATLARAGNRRDALNLIARATKAFADHGLPVSSHLAELEHALLDGTFALVPDPSLPPARSRELPRPLTERLATPFVGPAGHLAEMRGILHAAGDTARVIVVDGRSGAGKTRACAELALHARAHGFRALYVAPTRHGGAALAPLLAALPAVRDRVAVLFEGHDDAEARRAAMWAACSQALEAEAGGEPLLLIVDDCQWLDSYTAAYLVHVATHFAPGGLVLVLAGRDSPTGNAAWHELVDAVVASGARRIAPEPLDRRSTEELVRLRRPSLTEAQVRGVATDLLALSGGLPGVASLLVDALDEDTLLSRPAREVRPGRELDAAVRLVGDDARTVGAVASVVGPRFDLDLVEAISDLPGGRVVIGLDELVRRGLVIEHSITEFSVSHVLVQAAFIASETRHRIAGWHRAAAAMFAGDIHRHASHAAEAVPLIPAADASAALVRSAASHVATGEYRLAIVAYRRAADLGGPLRPRDAAGLARALDLAGLSSSASRVRQEAFEAALSQRDLPAALGIATSGLPEAEPVDGDPTIVENLERIDPAELTDPDDHWAHAHHLARQLAIVGRVDDARAHASRLPAMAREPAQRVDAAMCQRFVISATSPPGARLAVVDGAADDVAAVGGTRAAGYHLVVAIDRYEAGDVDRALEAIEAIDPRDEDVSPWRRWHSLLFRAMVATDRGLVATAERHREAAFDLAARSGLVEGENALLAAHFVDLWVRGRAAELRGLLDGGVLDPERSVLTRAGTAIVLAATGEPDRAAEHAARVVESVVRSPVSQGLAALALVSEVLAGSGDAGAVRRASAMLATRGPSMIVIGAGAACLGPVRRYAAALAPDPEARLGLLVSARSLADRAGLPLWQVIARRSLHELTGDRAHLDQAAALVDGTELTDLLPTAPGTGPGRAGGSGPPTTVRTPSTA